MKNTFLHAFTLILLLLAACQATPTSAPAVDLRAVLQAAAGVSGWQPQAEAQFFTKDTLYDLMNGQSDAFFVYGFERAGVRRFSHTNGAAMMLSVFQVDTPASAYGLFTANHESQPLALGSQGSTSPGRRISFWQDCYFAQITALEAVPDGDLLALGQAVSAALPSGGEVPALVKDLPQNGLAADPMPLFFHQELSIQDRVWLGGENRLGLSLETDGVLAQYDLDGQPVWLMLIEYPQAAQAQQASTSLEGAEGLLAARASGSRLAAVFGDPGLDLQSVNTFLDLVLK